MNTYNLYQVEMLLAQIVREAGDRGIPFDREQAEETRAEWFQEMDDLRSKIKPMAPASYRPAQKGTVEFESQRVAKFYKSAPPNKFSDGLPLAGPWTPVVHRTFDPDKNAEAKDFLLANGWKPAEWNFKNGKRTSPKLNGEDPFEGVHGEVGQMVARMQVLRHRTGCITSYLEAYRADNGSIKCGANTLGAESRRFRHRVVVNVPGADKFGGPKLRALFRAPPGYKWVGLDLDQAHLFIVGWLAGDQELMDSIKKGDKAQRTDVHTLTALSTGLLLSIDAPKETWSAARADAKIFIYTWLNNGGAHKISGQLGVSRGRAQQIIDEYNRSRPKISGLKNQLRMQWQSFGGRITLPCGEFVWPQKENSILADVMQAVEAALIKTAVVLSVQKLAGLQYKARFNLANHDEFSFICPEEEEETVAKTMEQAVVDACAMYGMYDPVPAGAQIGTNWLDAH